MCTVTWLQRNGGYELFCNRDERHTRKPAGPPAIHSRGGVQFIAPVDGDHGGSWIGVNQFGLAVCLLNRYDQFMQPDDGRHHESRGLLLTSLLDSHSSDCVFERVMKTDLSRYQSFSLLTSMDGAPFLVLHWNGREKSFENSREASMLLTSSSYQTAKVVASRLQSFPSASATAGGVTADLLLNFHRSHDPVRGPYSVCMHREEAATVSFSHIRVTEKLIEFSYQGQSPCSEMSPEVVVMARTNRIV